MSQQTQQAPFPGVFYRRPSPEADAFVSPGDHVEVGDTIGLLEVMKQFCELKAEIAGRVVAFNVDDGDVIEAGQEILLIDAAEGDA
ncbi:MULTISPECIES: acetyl-CoA carboxylase [Halomonas]|uniref:acetyl-CoA carboxylase n=1 Tax=Halomonas TaxID=2745 RepID=UPI001C94CC2B|nr:MULTISPECIES: acetyl-CoA carboxylase [Halomonas]MBY6207961.1 biotin carboxyl carrier domain-containing protein [Halomonas sp. DP3Y7-2]MBY6228770.1 biotin carboxyl carrier domain-containing protein [Halomonas sp. DP3Y7-1]MCA0917246.1 biotin carboxyl carrier domain-containing protein [Halomonas denitrificans]